MSGVSDTEIRYQIDHMQDNKSRELIVANVVSISAATTAVVLRLISRRLNKASLQADDSMIIIGLFFSAAYISGQLYTVHLGIGRHFVLVKDPAAFPKIILANSLTYLTALTAIKLSIILLYQRLFPVARFRKWLLCIAAYIICWQLYQTFSTIFPCRPIRGAWDPSIHAKCWDQLVQIILAAAQNVVTDIVILCSPIPMLWGLQMAKERKLQIIGLFALGGLVCIISIVRIPQVLKVSYVDPSWSDVGISLWSAAEVGAAVVSACLPVLRPIYTWTFHGRSSPELTRIPSHTTPSNPGSSIKKLFTFWRISSSSNRSNDTTNTSKGPHVIPTLNTSNGIDGDRWAARPISRIFSIYKKNKSRDSTTTAMTDVEMQARNSMYTGVPERKGTVEQSVRPTGKWKPGAGVPTIGRDRYSTKQ